MAIIRMNKLICSFKSDLPNEIDFAMQVATLLANSDNFIWSKDYPLVDAICSSLHVFSCICEDSSTCYCYPKFWHKILIKHASNIYLQASTLPPDMEQTFLNFEMLQDHELKNHNKIYKRIKTAAELIKQFSMTTGTSKAGNTEPTKEDINYFLMKKKKLKAPPSLLKFVSLLLFCDDAPLNLIGLDILSNTASKLSKIPEMTDDIICSKLVQMFQERCVDDISRLDGDIYIVNRSLEVVSRLISSSSKNVSSTTINLIVERNLVQRIEQFLTSHYDVALFLSALECCYRISRHQPHLLISSKTRYLMKILVNLLNCDDSRYFTPRALKRIKLIDEEDLTVLSPKPLQQLQPQLQQASQVRPQTVPRQEQQAQVQQRQESKPVQRCESAPQPANSTTVQPRLEPKTQAQQQNQPQLEPQSQPQPQTQAQSLPPTQQSQPAPQQPQPIQEQAQDTPQQQKQQTQPQQSQPGPEVDSQNNSSLALNKPVEENGNIEPEMKPAPQPTKKEYACEWDNCEVKFTDAKQVYTHVFEIHIGPLDVNTISSCLWSGPSGLGPGCVTKRPKFSLLTHLNDYHCNPTALERAANRSPIKPPEHPGYSPNAALLAIRRHANNQSDDTNGARNLQSPFSISVRLTAALILRNLATESSEMKQALENHEPLLSEICMTNGRDESKIIAECLSLFCNE